MARAQAQFVADAVGRRHPKLRVLFTWIESEGDQYPGELADVGGKGMFARAIERALFAKHADLAVHSMKDLPAVGTAGLIIAAVPVREDPRDVLVGPGVTKLDDLADGAVVGTSSPRRAAQLKRLRPDVQIRLIRGNVQTRLKKVFEEKQFDATLLAAAGLKRLGLEQYLEGVLDTDVMLPAAGQGALAVQARADDHRTLIRSLPINQPTLAKAVEAERRIVASLSGDCHSPIAAFVEPAEFEGKAGFRIRARVLSEDGSREASIDTTCSAKGLAKAVKAACDDLAAQGAREIMGSPPAQHARR